MNLTLFPSRQLAWHLIKNYLLRAAVTAAGVRGYFAPTYGAYEAICARCTLKRD